MLNCVKKCFGFEVFEIKEKHEKKEINFFYWGIMQPSEFLYLLEPMSDNNITGFEEKDLKYVYNNINSLLNKLNELLKLDHSKRLGDTRDYNIYDLIAILLEMRKYYHENY